MSNKLSTFLQILFSVNGSLQRDIRIPLPITETNVHFLGELLLQKERLVLNVPEKLYCDFLKRQFSQHLINTVEL